MGIALVKIGFLLFTGGMTNLKVKIDGQRLGQAIKVEGFTQPAFAKELSARQQERFGIEAKDIHPKAIERMASPSRDTYVDWDELNELSILTNKAPFQLLDELPNTYPSYGSKKIGTKFFEDLIWDPRHCTHLSVPNLPRDEAVAKLVIRTVEIFELMRGMTGEQQHPCPSV